MVVFHDDAVGHVRIERHLDTVLWVQAQPLPSVDARAAQVARGVAETGVIHRHPAVFPVGQFASELVRATVGTVHTHFALRSALLARGNNPLAAGVTVGRVSGAFGEVLARRALAAGTGDVEQFGIDVDHRLARVETVAAVLKTHLDVVRVTGFARDGRGVELVVAGPDGFGEGLLVLAGVVVEAVETHTGGLGVGVMWVMWDVGGCRVTTRCVIRNRK